MVRDVLGWWCRHISMVFAHWCYFGAGILNVIFIKGIDLPPKLENSERVIGSQKIPIGNNKEEDINSYQTNIPSTHIPIYKNIAVPVQFNTSNQVSARNNNKHQSSSRKKEQYKEL